MFWKSKPVGEGARDAPVATRRVEADAERPGALLTEAQRCEQAGRRGEGLRILNEAIARYADVADLWLARGSVYYGWSRFLEAYRAFGAGLQRFPNDINLCARFAWAAHSVGNISEAETLMRRVAEKRPDEADAHYGLGVVLRTLKRYEPAIDEFREVVDRDSTAAHAWINLGVSLMDLGRFDEAEAPLRRALELAPEDAGNWSNLAVNLYRQGRAEAEDAYKRALALEEASGKFVDSFVSYASYLRNVGRIDEAIAMYRRYLPLLPSTSGLTQLGMCLLHKGEFESGWALYEFRWLQEPMVSLRANLDTPVWQGQDIRGRTILVRAEQGVGDVVQFARYARAIRDLGANVLFQGRDGMEELTRRFDGVTTIINSGEKLPEFDYYTNLMSLPRFFGNDPAAVTFAPYIRIDAERATSFRKRLEESSINIGIVWAGNPTHQQDKQRSTSLAVFEPLADMPGVQLVSLQKGDAAGQLATSPHASRILDWGPLLNHFGDTVDAVDALDVIISVDTSVAHIAGAIGRPVWVVLPTPAEWRWMDDRLDSAWYPSARLFRQETRGDWASVGRALIHAVETIIGEKTGVLHAVAKPRVTPAITTPSFCPAQIPPGLTSIGEMREGIFEYVAGNGNDEGAALAWYGEWLHQQLGLLARITKLGQVVVEVGSGTGVHTVALSRLVGESGHLIAFENDPRIRRILGENLRANRVRNTTIMQGAFRGGETYPDRAAETIDSMELEKLDWIKVNRWSDVDTALDGAESTIWRTRPKLFLNMGDTSVSTFQRLSGMGYACWLHRSHVFREQNFNRVATALMPHPLQLAILAIPEEIDVDVELDDCESLGTHY